MTDLTFFNYSHPGEVRDREARKKIRAHVTRRQHALKRQSSKERPSAKRSIRSAGSDEYPANSSSASTSSSNQSVIRETPPASREKRRRDSEQRKPLQQVLYWNLNADEDITNPDPHFEVCRGPNCHECPYAAAATPSPASIDLDISPVPRKEWYGWLHDYWFNGTLPRATSRLKVTDLQLQRYIAWTRRLLVTEPAFYYMSLLLATGIPVANGQFSLLKALWLRGRTVQAINEALSDPKRATNDAVIQAVGQIALHEHIYGNRTAAHQIHRPAQQRMIEMRGGIGCLDLPIEVKQIMVWYDRLMAAEAGNKPYFASLVDGRDVKEYNDQEAIGVTNNASPSRYKHPGYYGTSETEHEIDD